MAESLARLIAGREKQKNNPVKKPPKPPLLPAVLRRIFRVVRYESSGSQRERKE